MLRTNEPIMSSTTAPQGLGRAATSAALRESQLRAVAQSFW